MPNLTYLAVKKMPAVNSSPIACFMSIDVKIRYVAARLDWGGGTPATAAINLPVGLPPVVLRFVPLSSCFVPPVVLPPVTLGTW